MRELLFEAFLALVERCHVSLVAKLRTRSSNETLVAPCITGLERQGNPLPQQLVRCAAAEVGLCRL